MHALSVAELSKGYANGRFTPLDVVRATQAHIARWEPRLNALFLHQGDVALAAAEASTERWRQGQPLSPLDGVPITLKDNIATRGHPTPLGTAATPATPQAEDAPPAARLAEAGCVLLAKTTMPDYGMLSSGLSTYHALARNPWNLARNPGGSSAGAGAAAAAGYGPLHLGTDIGGSIRLPANWCGVVGFKPSNGRVPIKPPYIGRVAGPMTRTVSDAAWMMSALAQPDARDTMNLPAQAIAWTALPNAVDEEVLWSSSAHTATGADGRLSCTRVLPHASSQHAHRTPGVRGLRIGLWLDAGWGLPLATDIRSAVESAAHTLATAGAHIVPLAPFATRAMADGINLFWRVRSWMDLQALASEQRERVLPFIRQWAAVGEHACSADLFTGLNQIGALREAAVAACAPLDFVLSPVAPVSAFDATWAGPTNDPQRAMEHIAYTLPFNMSEQPALSLPWGHTAEGLPIGVQLIGQRHDDVGVMRLARLMELLRPAGALLAWPEPPAT